MGGGASKKNKNQEKVESRFGQYTKGEDEFKDLKEKSDILAPFGILETLDEISRSKPEDIQDIIDSTYTEHKIDVKMKKEEYEKFIYNHVAEELIKKQFIRPQYDLFSEFNKNLFPIFFADKGANQPEDLLSKGLKNNNPDNQFKLKRAEKALKAFESQFNKEMLSVIYDIQKNDLKDYRKIYMAVNTNFKYNPEFKPKILNLILNPTLLTDEEFINDICVMIVFNKKLSIVSIIIDPQEEIVNFNLKNLLIINKVIRAVSINNSVKGLFIQCVSNTISLTLPQESSNWLLNKITNETLCALHLGRINLCDDFFKNMMYHLSGTKSLLYLGFENENIIRYLLRENTLLESIQNNTSLQALSLTGFYMTNERHVDWARKFVDAVKEKNKEIKLIYYGNKSFVTYPFNKDRIRELLQTSDGYEFVAK